MKLQFAVICAIFLGLFSCHRGSRSMDAVNDTLKYEYKTFKKYSSDCKDNNDSTCVFIKVSYPEFNDRQILNDSINLKLISLFSFILGKHTDFQQLSNKFLRMFRNVPDTVKNKIVYHFIDEYAKVLRQDSNIATLEVYGRFTQMDRPISIAYFLNWDSKGNRMITLNDLFNVGYEDSLKSIGEAIFKKDEKPNDTISPKRSFLFAYRNEKGFFANNNFSITNSGIRFYYIIGGGIAYPSGPTYLFIPYSDIRSLLKPNTVITQYLK